MNSAGCTTSTASAAPSSGTRWARAGRGRASTGSEVDHAAAAADGWAEIARRLAEQRHDFYVLDEFTYPLKWGWVDVEDVVEVLLARPGTQHVVITGRDAPPQLLDAADLVTEMTKVKHPMDVGPQGPEGHRVVTVDLRERPWNDSVHGVSAYKHGRPLLACGPRGGWGERPGRRHRRAGVGQRKDHRGNGFDGRAAAGGPSRGAVQGRPGLHRPRLPRAGGACGRAATWTRCWSGTS